MTAMEDGWPTDSDVRWAARQVVRQHAEAPTADRATGRCAQCRDGGCAMLTWARVVVAAHDPAARGGGVAG